MIHLSGNLILFSCNANFSMNQTVCSLKNLNRPDRNEARRHNVTTMTVQMTDLHATAGKQSTPSTSSSIEEMVEALRSGQDGALENLIKKTEKACYHLALSILKDPDLSKDALQETYFLVYRRVGQLREPAAFKGWLYRIVTSCCHDILRKRSKEVETDLGEREDLLGAKAEKRPTSDPSHEVPNREMIRSTFDGLADIDRQALALREICSLSYDEMSRVLSIPIGTVRSRLAKARKRFINAYRKEQKS
jgi:RNA polymerase sigma-70 factor (ECF subfamily)